MQAVTRLVAVATLLSLLGLAAVGAVLSLRVGSEPLRAAIASPLRAPDAAARPLALRAAPPVRSPAAAPRPRFLVAHVRPGGSVTLHARPAGPVLLRLAARTEFGSRRSLSVVRVRRGRWLGVTAPELGNGRLGWIDAGRREVTFSRSAVSLVVDLSRRELRLLEDGRVARRVTVSVGRPGSATPTGRFAVTDKLPGPRFSASYGCCILALSGRQTSLPAGWTGGDRLAIHGTPAGGGFGRAASAGCLHASAADLRALMRAVPVGAPVVIRA